MGRKIKGCGYKLSCGFSGFFFGICGFFFGICRFCNVVFFGRVIVRFVFIFVDEKFDEEECDAAGDEDVSDIECGPVVFSDVPGDEVDDVTQPESIDDISQSAAHDACERDDEAFIIFPAAETDEGAECDECDNARDAEEDASELFTLYPKLIVSPSLTVSEAKMRLLSRVALATVLKTFSSERESFVFLTKSSRVTPACSG